jgi:hypothetical protein
MSVQPAYSAQIHDQAFKACVARQAQYVFDTFYDRFEPGAYLRTHADHMRRWHHEASDGLAESAGPRGD